MSFWSCGDGGGSGCFFSILIVEVFFFIFELAVVCLSITTSIPRPSLRLESIGFSLFLNELVAFGHECALVSILCRSAISFIFSSPCFVEPSQMFISLSSSYQLSTNFSIAYNLSTDLSLHLHSPKHYWMSENFRICRMRRFSHDEFQFA